jgi:hypothetical protein
MEKIMPATDFFIVIRNEHERRNLREVFKAVTPTKVKFNDISVAFSLETAEQVAQLLSRGSYELHPGNGKPCPD